MRLAFISDIHGNLVALDSALADIKKRGIDAVICLGDIVDLGAPGRVIRICGDRDLAGVVVEVGCEDDDRSRARAGGEAEADHAKGQRTRGMQNAARESQGHGWFLQGRRSRALRG